MRKVLMGVGTVTLILAAVALSWYFRPWSVYSPAKVMEGRNAEDRVAYYRNMEAYFPYRTIAGSPDVRTLPRALRPLSIQYTHEGEARTLADYAADRDITSLMVVRDGNVILEEYWRGETADSRHTSWSVAKSFVATLVGIAVKDGKIDSLDDPVEKYAPLYQGTDYGRTTVRQLLMMSTGIDFEESYEAQGSDIRKLFFNTFLLNKDIDKFARVYDRNKEPETEFLYQSSNTAVLGAVVSGAYGGMPLADLAATGIFAPLGMESGTWLLDRHAPDGKELGYCCINLRLEDYAKFGLLYLNGGVAQGEQVLPEGWAEFVRTVPNAATHQPKVVEGQQQNGYGHHFWIPPEQDGVFFAAGYNGQFVWIDPRTQTVVAMTSADRAYPGHREAFALLRAASTAP